MLGHGPLPQAQTAYCNGLNHCQYDGPIFQIWLYTVIYLKLLQNDMGNYLGLFMRTSGLSFKRLISGPRVSIYVYHCACIYIYMYTQISLATCI